MRFPDALHDQARSCVSLGSPFMGRLLSFLADHMPRDSALWDRIETWPAPLGPSHASLPLRLAGGLHNLVLTGADPDLAAVYPPHDADDARLGDAVLAALARNQPFLLDWIARPPQTNEVRRSVGLIPAAHVIAARFPLPFVTSELGASGGINQMFDRYALRAGDVTLGAPDPVLTLTPDWTGPTPEPAPFAIADRGGVDLTPLNLKDKDEVTRLLSYLWPDQPDRRDLTLRAVAALDATIDKADAIDWLETRLATPRPGHVHVIYHTVAWQYFPDAVQARGEALIARAGAQATAEAPLARIAMEADGKGRGAGLTLRTWPDGESRDLARIDFHGRWIDWTG
ncbi:MAG: hypothetical protein CML66_17120 [Rhodobacteraceae bacterium]|nr:hypothetical protein [Paracoccaceae bacterium]MAY44033.1 hypothetical protein [Paracoccaceae bacterium]